ncbi:MULTISPECIES: aminotransferase class I/II-fold pyridoxal phosphate-dependent enzyme [unclassified Pseudomonas]|uniref:aminotransferase class I/II-fold pyridoxal phosphate-dependent enzyme n=1 Tax=unclassified Pseudomonas TaxID=196821 RepID=UPI000876E3B1|nr:MULTISPECIES: aminotransferase class I/II-fold pyridoxal phosphate-dependent enzyme [unclassified Pseudomonas]SCZ19076.1 aspartate aminotransferase [Pseudomonas sp. NFACC44-2]SDA46951.1 aspartate aminotransferase [Pseudomonas sp. NFACC51]SEI42391.1 aspartate aminotransferase [Pseudomonas sp. NFACC07-1]SFH01728.1 aspartate aminotransferase [Pseudomonas sp. NFACC54]SFS37242.1 aspartate aminotransferase [Pseudomonas sp. NFACC48-1]
MTLYLSKRVQRVSLSANAAAKSRATALREAGRDILDLTTGEPDFDTPTHIKQAAYAAIAAGATKYTPTPGVKALRVAVQRKLCTENQLDYPLESIVIANGAKQIIFNAFAATLDDGDEVLVPTPYWPSFPDSVRFNGGEPVFIECGLEQGCKLTPQQLEQHIGERTRWLILNSPGNPSGAVYSEAELQGLAQVLRRHAHVLILLDELYEHIRFDGRAAQNLLNVAPDLQARCLLVGGVSKTYAMTGWRIGFGAGPQALSDAMTVVQSQSTSGASSVGQAAALAAFEGGLEFLPEQVAAYRQRRDGLVSTLRTVEGLEVLEPHGGFFVFVRCAGLLGRYRPDGLRLEHDADVVAYLLDAGVAGVAGSAYGLSPWFRLSIATATETVAEAGRRIAFACGQLRGEP